MTENKEEFLKSSSLSVAASTASRSCRMSWFLIQQLESKVLSIIHSVDLVQDTNADIYLNKTITFNRDQATIEGTMLCASDNRQFIEDELKKRIILQNNMNSNEFSFNDSELWFLLQFYRNVNCIIHTIIKKTEIPWNLNNKYVNSREILIEDGNAKRLATILHFSENESEIIKEMQLLKNKSIQLSFEETKLKNDFEWLLIQYSEGENSVIYSIINKNETIWNHENFYNEFVTYIQDDDNLAIYQSIILKRSKYLDELEIELENIKDNTLLNTYPLTKNN